MNGSRLAVWQLAATVADVVPTARLMLGYNGRWLLPCHVPLTQCAGEELADVLLYLVRLSDACGIDLAHAAAAKLRKNAGGRRAGHWACK